MSALTLLSAIAPAVPSVPQGSSGEAVSGFQSLLAALSGDQNGSAAQTDPADTAAPDLKRVDAPPVSGFLIAPGPAPTPSVLPEAEKSQASGASNGSADPEGEDEAAPFADDAMPPPVPVVAADVPDDGRAAASPPNDKGLTARTPEPQVQPRPADIRPADEPKADVPATLAQAAAATEAVEALAQARTGAAPAPPPSAPPPSAPAPLRPLAERTSRPVDAPTAGTGDAPGVTGPVRPATAAVAPASPAADQPARPAEFAAALDPAKGGEPEAPRSDLPPLDDDGAVQTQAAAAARDPLVSQLSRATIEATAQIAAQILRRLEGRSTRFEMALTPDELGRVDVKLDIDAEGRLNARLAFDNPAAATDLRGRADELRRQLEDAGFHLADDAFEFAERDSGSSAFDRGQDARNGQSRAFTAASRLNDEIDVAQPPRWMALSLSPSGVDMKV
jgi:hypothetical protein